MVEATSYTHALGLRAEMVGKAAIVWGIVAALNWKIWGSIFGDDSTPIGAVKTGTTSDGKTTYWDLTSYTGLTRGMRQIGLLAGLEGWRQGSSPARIGDRAFESAFTSILHPAEGPLVSGLHTLATGKNLIGQSVVANPPPSGSHLVENARAALLQGNPATAALFGESRANQDMTWGQRALSLLGPYNPFKQHGDSTLAEMHGRLRELTDARRVFVGIPENRGKLFPGEREYEVLRAFDHAVQQLDEAMKGHARSAMGRVQMAKPTPERVKELRQRINALARRALERSRLTPR
jgi:hypothetical protein